MQVFGGGAASGADVFPPNIPIGGHKIAQQGVRRLLAVAQCGIRAVQRGKAGVYGGNGAKKILHGHPLYCVDGKKNYEYANQAVGFLPAMLRRLPGQRRACLRLPKLRLQQPLGVLRKKF